MSRPFLTAHWRYLAMLNYAIDPAFLAKFVPRGTELDSWNGTTYVSLVAFLFLDTKVLGVPIPFHRNFEEVNLRFYVVRECGSEQRRGVVFLREFVPRIAIATVARWCYNENYSSIPMAHEISSSVQAPFPSAVSYRWGRAPCEMKAEVALAGEPAEIAEGSEEEFICEHYWGYTRQRDGSTLEYRVDHPRWKIWSGVDAHLTGDANPFYGSEFASVLKMPPRSSFLCLGSEVSVYAGRKIDSRSC